MKRNKRNKITQINRRTKRNKRTQINRTKKRNKRTNINRRTKINQATSKRTNHIRRPSRVKSVKVNKTESGVYDDSAINNPKNLKEINASVHVTTLKAGSILYRTQPVSCKQIKPMYCGDTGKTGIYFSKNKYTPLGMILEYNKPMYLCKYKIKKNIKLYNGKYTFRSLEPTRYYKTIEDWRKSKFIFNIQPLKSINHIHGGVKGAEEYLTPLHDIFDIFDSGKGEKLWEKQGESEVFLTDPKLVECISQDKFSTDEATEEINKLIRKIN